MTQAEVGALKHGIYRLFWKDGGSSLASVGGDADGQWWYAPTNWLTVPGRDWNCVQRVAFLLEGKIDDGIKR